MQEIFVALIDKLNSSVFILIAILIVGFIMLFKIGKWFGQWTEKFFHQNEKIVSLATMSEKVIVMQTKIDLIYQFVNPNSPIKAQSPISLTKIGEEIAGKIKANEIIDKYIANLVKDVEALNPQNAYDIQTISLRITKEKLANYLSENELNLVKQEAYLKGILAEDVLSVFGILLRNYILRERGIPIADVDRHAKN